MRYKPWCACLDAAHPVSKAVLELAGGDVGRNLVSEHLVRLPLPFTG